MEKEMGTTGHCDGRRRGQDAAGSGRTVFSTDDTPRYTTGRVGDGMQREMWVEYLDWSQLTEATSTTQPAGVDTKNNSSGEPQDV